MRFHGEKRGAKTVGCRKRIVWREKLMINEKQRKRPVLVGLGSNSPDGGAWLEKAATELSGRFGVVEKGRIVTSPDVCGGADIYHNTIVKFWMVDGEADIRRCLKEMEWKLGRRRDGGDVCIDMDLLVCDGFVSDELWEREYNRMALLGLVMEEEQGRGGIA